MKSYPHPIVAREGWPFLALSVAVAAVATYFFGWWSLPLWVVALFILQFFRDPPREIPSGEGLVLCPADGRVLLVGDARDPWLNRDALKQAPSATSYFVPDDLLGWTVGRNRQSNDGLYFSSSEGIRSNGPNVSYAARRPRYRVATVGDSFTFALEVPFEASWPYRLEQQFGHQTQILNFGVNAYGVDQAYLRYSRDVRPWHPDLVVLAFIQHDLYRSTLLRGG